MNTFLTLAVYIVGVYVAYFKIQKWADHKVTKEDEYQTLFILSLLSWLVYPLYGIAYLIRKYKEE